jgi:amino acid transporter
LVGIHRKTHTGYVKPCPVHFVQEPLTLLQFRYWNKPGAFAEYITTGDLGRFEGFLGCLWSAAFTVVGPEYLSMLSGEVKLPRRYLKAAFKVTYVRFAFFFIGSALCVGIVIPYNDKTLLDILSGSSEGFSLRYRHEESADR